MHLTEWTQQCIHQYGGQGTNAYHPGTVQALSLMAIAPGQHGPITGENLRS